MTSIAFISSGPNGNKWHIPSRTQTHAIFQFENSKGGIYKKKKNNKLRVHAMIKVGSYLFLLPVISGNLLSLTLWENVILNSNKKFVNLLNCRSPKINQVHFLLEIM